MEIKFKTQVLYSTLISSMCTDGYIELVVFGTPDGSRHCTEIEILDDNLWEPNDECLVFILLPGNDSVIVTFPPLLFICIIDNDSK